MQSGRMDYAYRLSAARLAILRLRIARRWHRLLQNRSSSTPDNLIRGLSGVAVLMLVSGSAWVGYRAGQQVQDDPLLRAATPTSAANSQLIIRKSAVLQALEQPTASDPGASPASKIPVVSASDRIERQEEVARLAELVSLRRTVDKLQAQVQALEQEATGLEVELLNQQIAFAKAEAQWKEASVERRVVYNITNIPVGGSVSAEQIQSDAEMADFPGLGSGFSDQADGLQADGVDDEADPYQQYRNTDGPPEGWDGDASLADVLEQPTEDGMPDYTDQAIDRASGGSVEGYQSSSPSTASALPTDDQIRQEVFFGPAQDQYDDWINP